jgi:hypothetical protein
MKPRGRIAAILVKCLVVPGFIFTSHSISRAQNQTGSLKHPGLLNNNAELGFMRDQVIAKAEPWLGGYNKIPDYRNWIPQPVAAYRDGVGHEGDPYDTVMRMLVHDARAAYGAALRWTVTHDTAYAKKAMEILDAWSGKLQQIDTRDDGSLSTSYCWPTMIYAAEIIRYTYKGWPAQDQQRFSSLLKSIVWPATSFAANKDNGNNWKSLALFCRLTIAVFLDDRDLFNNQVDLLKNQITYYIYENGQCLETPRDLWHSQMGMAPLAAAAEIAWHQGVDLYSYAGNRLLKGVEWHIPFLLGATAGWPTVFSSTEKKYKGYPAPGTASEIWAFYELVYNHYHNRMGLETPNTLRLLQLNRPEEFSRTGGWGTATHSRHDLIPELWSPDQQRRANEFFIQVHRLK